MHVNTFADLNCKAQELKSGRQAGVRMRPEMVENGVKFLRHPSVQTTPLSERVSFLEQKGMTKDEIQEAIERFQSGDDATGAAISSPAAPATATSYTQPQQMMMHPQQQQQPGAVLSAPMAMAAAAPMQQLIRRSPYPPYIRVLWAISSLVGAASILGFMWNYAVQSGYVPWLRTPLMLTAGKVKEEEAENARKDEALMTGLTDMSAAIQAQTNELSKLCSSLDKKEQELATKNTISSQIATTLAEQTTNQAISELKAEISTLKALLLTKNTTKDVETKVTTEATTASTPSPVAANQPAVAALTAPVVVAAPQPAIIAKAEKVESVLKLVRTQNSLEQLKLAAGILTMYVKNLVENPDVPRYRRIAPGNANFKQKVEPLQHHEDLLKAIGFETNGLNMEWKWHTADRSNGEFDDNLALLRAVLKALQSLTAPSASSSLSLEEIAHESLDEYRQKKSSAKSDAASSVGSEDTSTLAEQQVTPTPAVGPRANDLNSFMARLEKKASSVNNASEISSKKSVEITEPAAPAVSADALLEEEEKPAAVSLEDEEKQPASAIESASTSAGPAYPKSFNDVMELIQKGEKVPGIKDIEEKISVDSEAYMKSAMASTTEEEKDGGELVAPRAAVPSKPWEKVQG